MKGRGVLADEADTFSAQINSIGLEIHPALPLLFRDEISIRRSRSVSRLHLHVAGAAWALGVEHFVPGVGNPPGNPPGLPQSPQWSWECYVLLGAARYSSF